jgi:uncharacterized membrane protein
MATITNSIVVERAPDEVFAYLDDLEAHREWQDGIESIKVVTDGPTHVGTEVEETRVVGGGQKVAMRWRVTEHDPATRRSAFDTIEGKMMLPSGVISVAPAGEHSEVTFSMDMNPVGFGKVLAPLMKRSVTKEVEGDLARLKARLEGGGAAA